MIPTWNVCCADINTGEIRPFNIFEHRYFWEGCQKAYQASGDKTVFAKKINSELKYWYWSKCEWELVISGFVRNNIERKIDVYEQVMLNWDRFIDYLWNWFKCTKREHSADSESEPFYCSDD